jgi:hypothetical protein
MHIQSLLLLPILGATALAQSYPYPTTSPEEYLALKYGSKGTDDATSKPVDDGAKLATRGGKGVYVCNQQNWRGNCWWAPLPGWHVCQNWDTIRSIGPDQGLACDLFEGEGCRGNPVERFITHEGDGRAMGKNPKSFKCGV